LDHTWIAHRWLPDLGLPQYSSFFEEQLIDGRLLGVLSRKEFEKQLCVQRKFHQASLLHGIELLRRVNFDKEVWHTKKIPILDYNGASLGVTAEESSLRTPRC
jgi:hypothetical protein